MCAQTSLQCVSGLSWWQDAGVIPGVRCHLFLLKMSSGATQEAASVTANQALAAQPAATVCQAIGGSARKAANSAPAHTAATQPQASV